MKMDKLIFLVNENDSLESWNSNLRTNFFFEGGVVKWVNNA